jgi:predicted small secreted protein
MGAPAARGKPSARLSRNRARATAFCSRSLAQRRRKYDMVRKIFLAAGIAAFSLTAAACNTVKGVGEDIESVGEAGDEAIN